MRKSLKIEDVELGQSEREHVIEKLLSQEKVLSILYDKTFPQQAGIIENPESMEEGGLEPSLDKEHELDRLENELLSK